jgi:hypothetical protein
MTPDAMFVTASRMLADPAGGHARGGRFCHEGLLSCPLADDFYELVCDRAGKPRRAMVLTSNRSPADWYPFFSNAVVGESVLNRVINTATTC